MWRCQGCLCSTQDSSTHTEMGRRCLNVIKTWLVNNPTTKAGRNTKQEVCFGIHPSLVTVHFDKQHPSLVLDSRSMSCAAELYEGSLGYLQSYSKGWSRRIWHVKKTLHCKTSWYLQFKNCHTKYFLNVLRSIWVLWHCKECFIVVLQNDKFWITWKNTELHFSLSIFFHEFHQFHVQSPRLFNYTIPSKEVFI